MSLHIIIDGYNLIHQSITFYELLSSDIEQARDALVDALAAYKRIKPHKITVVFDGWHSPDGCASRYQRRGIHIRFSTKGESADSVIKRMSTGEREKALIVSSDQDVVRFAESQGAASISSPQFEARIQMAGGMTHDADPEAEGGWVPTTKKKGPSRRLPKRLRRNRRKVDKL